MYISICTLFKLRLLRIYVMLLHIYGKFTKTDFNFCKFFTIVVKRFFTYKIKRLNSKAKKVKTELMTFLKMHNMIEF